MIATCPIPITAAPPGSRRVSPLSRPAASGCSMISLPDELGPVASAHRVAGGDINDAWAVELESGERLFVKTRSSPPPGEYAAEAAGLAWLGDAGVRVPEVVAVDEAFLALRWVDEG